MCVRGYSNVSVSWCYIKALCRPRGRGGFVEESKLVLVMSKSVKSNSLLGVSKSMLESMVSRGLG